MADNGPLAEYDKNGENVDPTTFEQILEMDDDEDERDFSKGIVFGFFEQAETTFQKMDQAITEKDLPALSSLGHFLKGSSATLGLVKVRDACERIQHLGNLKENGDAQVGEQDNDWYLEKIKGTVAQVKVDYMAAEKVLKKFYHHE